MESRPNANVMLLISQIMIREHRFQEAMEMLDEATALEPEHGGLLIARGDVFALNNRPGEALAFYEQAARIDPYRAKGSAEDRIARLRAALSGGQP